MARRLGYIHRSPTQILKDRGEIARLYLQGKPQHEIGARLGFERTTISKELKAIRAEWLNSAVLDFHARKAQELAKIDHLEQTYWQAWADQRQPPPGDPRFLAGVQWCIDKRCELFGLNAPKRLQLALDTAIDALLTELGVREQEADVEPPFLQ